MRAQSLKGYLVVFILRTCWFVFISSLVFQELVVLLLPLHFLCPWSKYNGPAQDGNRPAIEEIIRPVPMLPLVFCAP